MLSIFNFVSNCIVQQKESVLLLMLWWIMYFHIANLFSSRNVHIANEMITPFIHISRWIEIHNRNYKLRQRSIYLWLYSPLLGVGHFFSFLILYTDGRTPWTGDQPVAWPLPTPRTTQTQTKRTQTFMPRMGFEPTTPVFEWTKTFRASDSTTTAIIRQRYRIQIIYLEWITHLVLYILMREKKERKQRKKTNFIPFPVYCTCRPICAYVDFLDSKTTLSTWEVTYIVTYT
jgi:hypothetical protein